MPDPLLPTIRLSDELRRECERKGVGHEDMEKVAWFQTFLSVWGKPGSPPESPEQAAVRNAMLNDPEWREYLGLPPKTD